VTEQTYIFIPGDTMRLGRRPLRLGEGSPFSHGGGFWSSPDEEDGINPCCFELEDGTGTILTEDGAGCIDPEDCP